MYKWIKEVWEGKRQLGENVERATAIPATASLFTIAGGKIMLTAIVGTITASLDANATAVKLVATPTVGTATDMCTAVNIASYVIGDLISITGTVGDALLPAATAGVIRAMVTPLIVQAGTIDMDLGAGGQVTGRIRWTLKYIPLDAGASVVAA
ncbi:MAG: hypothetical protein NUV34_06175 [Sulfuricaulis sp.]|nr:hypothetical protein [Sulfuricaulis sp.]